MADLRTAAQQALEVLENAEDQLAKPYSTDASNAIIALRAALAQADTERALHERIIRSAAGVRDLIDVLIDGNAIRTDRIERLGETVQRLQSENESLRAALAQAEPMRVISIYELSKMAVQLDGLDRTSPGYHYRNGWNDALRKAMYHSATPQQAEPVQRKPGSGGIPPACRSAENA